MQGARVNITVYAYYVDRRAHRACVRPGQEVYPANGHAFRHREEVHQDTPSGPRATHSTQPEGTATSHRVDTHHPKYVGGALSLEVYASARPLRIWHATAIQAPRPTHGRHHGVRAPWDSRTDRDRMADRRATVRTARGGCPSPRLGGAGRHRRGSEGARVRAAYHMKSSTPGCTTSPQGCPAGTGSALQTPSTPSTPHVACGSAANAFRKSSRHPLAAHRATVRRALVPGPAAAARWLSL